MADCFHLRAAVIIRQRSELMLHVERNPHWGYTALQTPGPVYLQKRKPDLYVAVFGRFFSNGRFLHEQISPGFAMHVIESGSGVMEMDGVSYTVGTGDVFIFFPGRHLRYHDEPRTPWRYCWVTFEGARAAAELAEAGITASSPLRHGDFAAAMKLVFHEIEVAYRQPQIAPTFSIAAAWRLMEILVGQPSETTIPHHASKAEIVRSLIDRDYMQCLSVASIARQVQMSRSALFRCFRAAYGVSPKNYLETIRMEQARRLLRQQRLSIKEIAAACGYSNGQYFSRAFKRHCGMTPGQWRSNF